MSDRIKADLDCQALKSPYWQRKPSPGLIMQTDPRFPHGPVHEPQGRLLGYASMESFLKTLTVARVH